MEIRRKVFSLLEDENGEERYYSTTEFEIDFDEETGEKMFSESESKLEKSSRGYVTAAEGGLVSGIAAVKAGRAAARKAEKQGKSESEMIDAAGKTGTKVAGGIKAASGLAIAGSVGIIANRLVKNPDFRQSVKESLKASNAPKEVMDAARNLGKGGKVGLAAAGVVAAALAPRAIGAARRAGDGARKNVTKGLVKSHEDNEDKD